MFKADLDKVRELHEKYGFEPSLLDAGGLAHPVVADYTISATKALTVDMGMGRTLKVPHPVQDDRYIDITRPWTFIDPNYIIENPQENQGYYIEQLPEKYHEFFSTIIMVSVMEHVKNPFQISDCIFKILRPGGFLFNSTPFVFPFHPSPEDNFRFSPQGLRHVHESSGFEILECDFHLKHNTNEGIGDTNPERYGQPQAIWASFALCRKNEGSPK